MEAHFDSQNLKLLTIDPAILKKYMSNVIMLQSLCGAYLLALKQSNDAAKRLISLLKKEYDLN